MKLSKDEEILYEKKLKTTQNKQKYCMEILDDFFAENVDAMRF